jgi:acyl dehydratase
MGSAEFRILRLRPWCLRVTDTERVETRFDVSRVGERFDGPPVEITVEASRAFAEATNDTNDAFKSGRLAPPLYAVVPVLKNMVAAKNSVTQEFAFHGEHDLTFFTHLRPGMIVTPTATVVGVHQRSAGVAVVVRIRSHAEDGLLLNEQYFTSLAPGATLDKGLGEDAPRRVPPQTDTRNLLHELAMPLDHDQTRRFAAASDDWDSYTLDEGAARRLGFPTIIVHGLCTMAFAGRAVVEAVCGGDAQRLRRLSMRLSQPVFLVPGQSLTARIYAGARETNAATYSFELTDRDGRTVVKNGLAEVLL